VTSDYIPAMCIGGTMYWDGGRHRPPESSSRSLSELSEPASQNRDHLLAVSEPASQKRDHLLSGRGPASQNRNQPPALSQCGLVWPPRLTSTHKLVWAGLASGHKLGWAGVFILIFIQLVLPTQGTVTLFRNLLVTAHTG